MRTGASASRRNTCARSGRERCVASSTAHVCACRAFGEAALTSGRCWRKCELRLAIANAVGAPNMREGEYSRARPTSRLSGPECKGGDRCGDMRIVHPPAARARRCALVLAHAPFGDSPRASSRRPPVHQEEGASATERKCPMLDCLCRLSFAPSCVLDSVCPLPAVPAAPKTAGLVGVVISLSCSSADCRARLLSWGA